MTLFPDIIREAKIISGKDQIPYVKEQLLAMASGLAANNTYYDASDENGERIISKKKLSSSATPGEKTFLPNLIFNYIITAFAPKRCKITNPLPLFPQKTTKIR